MDLFGKQARQELEQFQKKLTGLELQHSDVVSKLNSTSEELRESKSLVAAINAANLSKAEHQNLKEDHDHKAAEYARKCKEIAEKEAELLTGQEARKAYLRGEMCEIESKLSLLIADLTEANSRAEALKEEILAGEGKRDIVAAEYQRLVTSRSEAETELRITRQQQRELIAAIDKLTRQQEALAGSNQHLSQLTFHLNRDGDEDTVFASLEHDLHRFLTHDRTSGAMQVTLKARPLLLVVDIGHDSLNLAAVRAGLITGTHQVSLQVEARKTVGIIGGSRIETVFAAWLWGRFTAVHPRLKNFVKQQKGVELCLSVSQRLLALICQGAPQGDVEETIVIDSEQFSASIPLLREELVSVFLPLLGPDGELTGVIQRFFAESKLSVDATDRIVSMGWYGRLPLLRESLGAFLKKQVLMFQNFTTVSIAS